MMKVVVEMMMNIVMTMMMLITIGTMCCCSEYLWSITLKPSDLCCRTISDKNIIFMRKKCMYLRWQLYTTNMISKWVEYLWLLCVPLTVLKLKQGYANQIYIRSDSPFVIFCSNSKNNGWLGRKVNVCTMKCCHGNSTSRLCTAVYPYESKLYWVVRCSTTHATHFLDILIWRLASDCKVYRVFCDVTRCIGWCFPR